MTIKVSVLMTVYNDGNRYLQQSILSILSQSYRNLELIIVNDGFNDNTRDIIKNNLQNDERIVFIDRIKNKGRSYSLNEGLEACTGDFVFINDADDISDNTRIESCINFYKENVHDIKKFGVLGTAFVMFNTTLNENKSYYLKYGGFSKKKIKMWRIFIGMPFPHSSFMYRKAALIDVGGFPTDIVAGIDYFTLMKIANKYDIYGINKVLVKRIIDGKNYFMNPKISNTGKENTRIIEKWAINNVKFSIIYINIKKLYLFIVYLKSTLSKL